MWKTHLLHLEQTSVSVKPNARQSTFSDTPTAWAGTRKAKSMIFKASEPKAHLCGWCAFPNAVIRQHSKNFPPISVRNEWNMTNFLNWLPSSLTACIGSKGYPLVSLFLQIKMKNELISSWNQWRFFFVVIHDILGLWCEVSWLENLTISFFGKTKKPISFLLHILVLNYWIKLHMFALFRLFFPNTYQ